MGTIPKSAVLLAIDSKTDRIDTSGIFSTDFPNWPSNAVSEKVPSEGSGHHYKLEGVALDGFYEDAILNLTAIASAAIVFASALLVLASAR